MSAVLLPLALVAALIFVAERVLTFVAVVCLLACWVWWVVRRVRLRLSAAGRRPSRPWSVR